MYVRHMSLFVSLASSSVAMIICVCYVVFLCGLHPFIFILLKCSIVFLAVTHEECGEQLVYGL